MTTSRLAPAPAEWGTAPVACAPMPAGSRSRFGRNALSRHGLKPVGVPGTVAAQPASGSVSGWPSAPALSRPRVNPARGTECRGRASRRGATMPPARDRRLRACIIPPRMKPVDVPAAVLEQKERDEQRMEAQARAQRAVVEKAQQEQAAAQRAQLQQEQAAGQPSGSRKRPSRSAKRRTAGGSGQSASGTSGGSRPGPSGSPAGGSRTALSAERRRGGWEPGAGRQRTTRPLGLEKAVSPKRRALPRDSNRQLAGKVFAEINSGLPFQRKAPWSP